MFNKEFNLTFRCVNAKRILDFKLFLYLPKLRGVTVAERVEAGPYKANIELFSELVINKK